MKTIYNLIQKIDKHECIDILISLHRLYYFQPGYILNNELLFEKYNNLYELLSKPPSHTDDAHKIYITHSKKEEIYNVLTAGILLRDAKLPLSNISSAIVDYPKNMSAESVILEILFEISYYEFVETT